MLRDDEDWRFWVLRWLVPRVEVLRVLVDLRVDTGFFLAAMRLVYHQALLDRLKFPLPIGAGERAAFLWHRMAHDTLLMGIVSQVRTNARNSLPN